MVRLWACTIRLSQQRLFKTNLKNKIILSLWMFCLIHVCAPQVFLEPTKTRRKFPDSRGPSLRVAACKLYKELCWGTIFVHCKYVLLWLASLSAGQERQTRTLGRRAESEELSGDRGNETCCRTGETDWRSLRATPQFTPAPGTHPNKLFGSPKQTYMESSLWLVVSLSLG